MLLSLALAGAGVWAYQALPMDAYPDLSPPYVEIISQWPGHSAEEVERLITVPVERGMNAIPGLTTKRSISLYGLSDVTLTFDRRHRSLFRSPTRVQPSARNHAADWREPHPCHPCRRHRVSSIATCCKAPDRSPMELKTIEDWVIAPQYRSVPGVADDSAFGGGDMQYQVMLESR